MRWNEDERYSENAKILKDRLYNQVLKNDVNLVDQDIDVIEERRQVSTNMFHNEYLQNKMSLVKTELFSANINRLMISKS